MALKIGGPERGSSAGDVVLGKAHLVLKTPVPVVWFFYDREDWSVGAFSDPHHAQPKREKRETIGGMLVQPSNRREVRLAECRGDPDHRLRFEPCEICHDLAEVGMVGQLQLI